MIILHGTVQQDSTMEFITSQYKYDSNNTKRVTVHKKDVCTNLYWVFDRFHCCKT